MNQEEAIKTAQEQVDEAQREAKESQEELAETKKSTLDSKAAVTAQMVSGTVMPQEDLLRDKLFKRYQSGKLVKADFAAISGFATPKTDGTSDVFYYDENKSNKENLAELERVGDFASLPNEEYIKHSSFMNALVSSYEKNPLLSLYGRFSDNREATQMMKNVMLMYGGDKAKKAAKKGSFIDVVNSLNGTELYASYYDIINNLLTYEAEYMQQGYDIGVTDDDFLDDPKVKELRESFKQGPSSRFGIINKMKKPFYDKRNMRLVRGAVMTPEERGAARARNLKESITGAWDYLSTDTDVELERERKKIIREHNKKAKDEYKMFEGLSDDEIISYSQRSDPMAYKLIKEMNDVSEIERLAGRFANPADIREKSKQNLVNDLKQRKKYLIGEEATIAKTKDIAELEKNVAEDPDYLRKQAGYEPNKMLSMAKGGIERAVNFFGDRTVDEGTYDEYISSVEGFSNKLNSAGEYLQGFQGVVQELANVFPPLQIAVVSLTVTMEILKKAEMAAAGLSKFMQMGKALRSGKSITLFKDLLGGKGIKVTGNTRLGKMIGGTSSMLGRVGSFIAANAGPIAIILAAIAALAIALKFSYESHKKYVETLKKEQKELQSQARSLEQQTYIMKRQADHMGDTPAKLRLTKQLELAEKKLMMVQTRRRANTINLAMANEDALNGETGLWFKLTNLWGGAQSHVEEREGLYGRVQEAHEWAEGDLFGAYTTDAIQAVSDLKASSPFEYQAMENYGPELKSLYDMQSRAIKRTGSYEGAENDRAYQRKKMRIMNQTGLSEKEVDTLLENMQTEHQVSQAKNAMEAQRDTVRSQHELKRAAARMGVNPEELESMKGTAEYQRLMIQAQADMIQQEEKGAAFMAIIKDLGMNILIEIGAIVKSIWDLAIIVSSLLNPEWWILLIKAAVWGTEGWEKEDLDKLEAPGKAAEDIKANGGRMYGAVAATWEDVDYALEVHDQQYNDDLMAAADSVYDPTARNNFGNGPKNMYHLGGSGGRYIPGMSSQSNNSQTAGASTNQNQISSNSNNQGVSANYTTKTQQNGGSATLTANQKRVASAGTTRKPVSNNRTLSPKSSAVNDSTTPNVGQVVEHKNTDNSKTDNSNNVTIQNININTEDDPEAIKAMFLELIIELQEQINPRQVSRTVGEVPETSNTNTDSQTPPASSNGDSSGSSSSNGSSSSSGSGSDSSGSSTPQPSAAAIQRHRSNKTQQSAPTDKFKTQQVANKYDLVRKAIFGR